MSLAFLTRPALKHAPRRAIGAGTEEARARARAGPVLLRARETTRRWSRLAVPGITWRLHSLMSWTSRRPALTFNVTGRPTGRGLGYPLVWPTLFLPPDNFARPTEHLPFPTRAFPARVFFCAPTHRSRRIGSCAAWFAQVSDVLMLFQANAEIEHSLPHDIIHSLNQGVWNPRIATECRIMEFRWVVFITLWTMLSGPVFYRLTVVSKPSYRATALSSSSSSISSAPVQRNAMER